MPDSNLLRDVAPLARKHPKAYIVAHVVGGVVLIALLMWAFAALADELPENGWMVHLDHAVTNFVQARNSEGGERFFVVVSLFGAPLLSALVAVMSLIYASRRDWLRAGLVAFTATSGALLNAALKQVFHRGRPEFATEFIAHHSWSFPSGHAMESLIGYGVMAYLLLEHAGDAMWRRLLVAAVVILIILIATSRVYLGVHYLSDVIAGWLAGGAWLVVCIAAYRAERRRLHAR